MSIIASTAKLFSPFDLLSRISIETETILEKRYIFKTFNFEVWSLLGGLFVELQDAKGWLWFKWVSWSVAKHFRAPLSTIFASPPSSSSAFTSFALFSSIFASPPSLLSAFTSSAPVSATKRKLHLCQHHLQQFNWCHDWKDAIFKALRIFYFEMTLCPGQAFIAIVRSKGVVE